MTSFPSSPTEQMPPVGGEAPKFPRNTNPFAGPRVPRVIFLVALIVVILGVGILFAGAWRIGISYDEPFHVLRLQNFLDHGWYLLGDDLDSGMPGDWVDDTIVYAPVATILLHGLNIVVGNDSPGSVSFTAEAYAVRHLGVAFISLLGVASAAGLARIILGSWKWAVVAAAILMSLPLWTGHAMVNVKDIPVASGYTMAGVALAVVITRSSGRKIERLAVGSLLFSGTLLAVGTRPGIWPGLAAAAAITVIGLFFLCPRRVEAIGRCMDIVAAMVLVWVSLLLIYPRGFLNVSWMLESVFSSANYGGGTLGRFALPVSVIREVPTLLLLCGVVGLVVFLRRVTRNEWRSPEGVVVLLVLVQSLLLPVLAAANASPLHGLRQVLFAAPTAAVLLCMGIARGYPQTKLTTQIRPPVNRFVAWVSALAVIAPLVSQLSLFPYSYTYASIAVASPALPVGSDQWRTSVRELEPNVPEGIPVVCTPIIDESGVLHRYSIGGGRSVLERSRDCRTDDLSPLRPYREMASGLEDEPVSTTFAGVVTVPPVVDPINCSSVGEVVRTRHFIERMMSRVYSCDLVLSDLPGNLLEFDGDHLGSRYLLGGWTGSLAAPVAKLIGRRGDVGFAWPGGVAQFPFELNISAVSAGETRVYANNTLIGVLGDEGEMHTIRVDSLPRSELDRVGVVLTFRAAKPGGLVLRSIGVGANQ